MMTRRKFSVMAILGSLIGFVFGIKAQAEFPDGQTVKTEHDYLGTAVAQAYKLHEDGTYRHVKRHTLKAGDVFVMIGVDGDRLWRVEKFEVDGEGHFFHTTGRKIGTESVYIKDESKPVHIFG